MPAAFVPVFLLALFVFSIFNVSWTAAVFPGCNSPTGAIANLAVKGTCGRFSPAPMVASAVVE